MPFRRAAGITLIELLIVLSVASLLLTLAAPSLRDVLERNRVAGITNELTGILNLARSEAITRGTAVSVCKSADTATAIDNDSDPHTGPTCAGTEGWQAGWLVFVDGGTEGSVDDTDLRLKVGEPSAIDIVIDGGGDAADPTDGALDYYVRFFPNGSSHAAGTLTVASPTGERRIDISRTGRIRVERP